MEKFQKKRATKFPETRAGGMVKGRSEFFQNILKICRFNPPLVHIHRMDGWVGREQFEGDFPCVITTIISVVSSS